MGALSGIGTVMNNRTANDRNPTLHFGLDDSSTTFSGNFINSVTTAFYLRKIGTGTFTYSGGGTGRANVGRHQLLSSTRARSAWQAPAARSVHSPLRTSTSTTAAR